MPAAKPAIWRTKPAVWQMKGTAMTPCWTMHHAHLATRVVASHLSHVWRTLTQVLPDATYNLLIDVMKFMETMSDEDTS
jgi:hypothetical protein